MHFESKLEHDLLVLLEFDPEVSLIEEQPVRIPFLDQIGRSRSYVPDFLVHYHQASPHTGRRTELLEVKYEEELVRLADELTPKFRAAEYFAEDRGWSFRVVTDVDIQTPRLKNAQFLLSFQNNPVDELREARVRNRLFERGGVLTYQQIVDELSTRDSDDTALIISSLWRMVAVQRLTIDLDTPITPHTEMRVSRFSV